MGWFPNKQERDAMDEELLPASLREQQLAARRVPAWLRIVVAVPSIVYAIYSIATFTGPYRWSALFEVRVFGGTTYHPQLAGLFTFLVCLIPPLIVTLVLRRLFPPTAEELARPPRATARQRDRL